MRECCRIGKIWVRFVLIFLQKSVTKKLKKETKQGNRGYAENPRDTAVLRLAALGLTFSKKQKTSP